MSEWPKDSVGSAIRELGFETSARPSIVEDRQARHEVVVEEPLEIRVAGRPWLVTLRTPGHDRDLVVGLLHHEGVLHHLAELEALELCSIAAGTRAEVQLGEAALDRWALRRIEREAVMTAACGACSKSSVEDLELERPRRLTRERSDLARSLDDELVRSLPAKMGEHQQVFARTGGLHAAALFTHDGELLVVREDIGRHNAVDKAMGALIGCNQTSRLRAGDEQGSGLRHVAWGTVLVTSGRAGFELVHKALCAEADALVAVGAASSLAVDLAQRFGLGLYWFVRPDGGRRLPAALQEP